MQPAKTGVYLPGFNRFLFVAYGDLAVTLEAAKLLSSKMSLVVYSLPAVHALTNENCLSWGLAKKSVQLSATQKPMLLVLRDTSDVEEAGPSPAAEALASDQKFALFVHKATTAMRLTDAQLNTADHLFFLNLLSAAKPNGPLLAQHDDSKMPAGFCATVQEILYLAPSETEAREKLMALFSGKRTGQALETYMQTFYSELETP